MPAEIIPLEIKEAPQWKAVTEVINIRRRHGKEWLILGDVVHKLFEGISKGIILEQDIKIKAQKLFASKGIAAKEKERLFSIIEKDISLLKEKGIWQDIIMPKENSFAELPFILDSEKSIYAGRVDRVIRDNDTYKIYDYKTFPVDKKETKYLLKEYSFQLGIYKKAVKMLFNAKDVKSFIVFTHVGEIREVD
ncbi:MAG: PD-(D/E)XK nuclease family protein [Nitrospirae bacterium]|nr:PD-(D/E)XK nuclease family protein [Nitrospirota bacterium]